VSFAIAVAGLAFRLVLGAVLALAGIAKLADRRGTREAVVAFGASERAAGLLAVLLPIAELAAAGLLLPATTAAAGSAAALVLLGLFSAAIAYNLARGRSPDCHCFGQLHSAPASWKTLARNGALLAVAAFALAGSLARPDRSAVAWIGRLHGTGLLGFAFGLGAAVFIGLGIYVILSLLGSYGRVLIRLERIERALTDAGIDVAEPESAPEIGLAPGTKAPEFPELDELLAPGIPLLVLFTSPHCGPCRAVLPEAARWQREHAETLTVAFATDGDPEEIAPDVEEFGLEHVLDDSGRRLYDSYQASGTPSAVLVAPDATIASWVAPGRDWILQLVDDVLTAAPEETGLPVGTDAPNLELPSLDGDPIELDSFKGHDTMLLFWNPSCGFCRAMHDDMLAWESSPNGGPRLVVVSTGDADATREERFRSLVLLDPSYEAGNAFGAGGTPMAVLLDADGRIASPLAAGADAVFALARGALAG
jgi:thiol-disulfide isomerase/thioredoxin